MSAVQDTVPSHLRATFTRRTLPAIIGLLLLALAAMVVALLLIADAQDRQARERSLFFAGKALETRRADIARTVVDNAFWGDAYEHLNKRTDLDWAYHRQSLGPSLYEDFQYEGVLVVQADGRTSYSVIRGELAEVDAHQWLQGGLPLLLEQAREAVADEESATGFLLADGRPALVAAAQFTTGGDEAVTPSPEPAAVLLFVYVLGEEKLIDLGTDFGLTRLRIATPDEPQALSLPLALVDDTPLQLAWDPERPGRQLLVVLLPIVALAALVLALLTWLVLRHALRTARLIDAGYADLLRNREALAASEERFRDVAEAASDWLWEIDAEYRLTYLSGRFLAVTGHHPEDWLGRPLTELLESEGMPLPAWLHSSRHLPLRCRYAEEDGRRRICRIAARPVVKGDQEPIGYRGTASDITAEVEAHARILHLSQHDALTGLPNRTRMSEFLEGKLNLLEERSGGQLVMLSIDLDRFKPVNDAFGHAAGDHVLNEVSERLRHTVREGDLVARLGGDEFILVLDGLTCRDDIERLCGRLIERLKEPFMVEGNLVFIGASIGIAMAPHDALCADELLRCADVALYQAKADGRACWRFFSSEMNERLVERHQLERDLREGLREDQLRLHFQPRYSLDNQGLAGAEALVRWQHPQRGLLSPNSFIPVAEDSGLIVPLGNWVLHSACQQAMQWPEQMRVSVNLSPVQFRRGDLVEEVRQALAETGLPAARLELEITESVMLEDAEGALHTLNALKALGVCLSMDDFGTGYSSLSYLRTYPFDSLKIDRSFVSGIHTNQDDRAIVQAIIGLGRALDMKVVAEGVEYEEQLALLRLDNCHEAQGYHLSRPLPAEELKALIQRQPEVTHP